MRHAAQPPRRTLAHDTRGVVYVEFVVVFFPVFLIFLGALQLALLGVGALVVRHAATRAVRSAVVVLADDPAHYGGALPGDLLVVGPEEDGWSDDFANQLSANDVERDHENAAALPRFGHGGARMAAIARAAYAPLSAITPGPARVAQWLARSPDSVHRTLGDASLSRTLHSLAFHAPLTTAVTFPVAPGDDALHERVVPPDAPVTVRVTHLFDCAVPVAAALVCGTLFWNPTTERLQWFDATDDDRAGFDELRRAAGAGNHPLLGVAPAHFALLRAEATLPAQSAAYRYARP